MFFKTTRPDAARPDYSGNEEIVIGRASFDKADPAQTEVDLYREYSIRSREEMWKAKAEVRRLREAAQDILAILEIGIDPGPHHMDTLDGRAAWIDRMRPVRERLRAVLEGGGK